MPALTRSELSICAARAIPTVDLRILLSGQTGDLLGTEKVAIIQRPGGRVGLVVDGISNVIRVSAQQTHQLTHGTGSPAADASLTALISQLYMDKSGTQIIHLLDLDALMSLPDVVLAQALEVKAVETERHEVPVHYLLFRCGDLAFCLEAQIVHGISDASALEGSGFTNTVYRGSIALRGRSIPIVSLLDLLEVGHNAEAGGHLLILELSVGPVGLLISSVTDIVKRRKSEILPIPRFGVATHSMLMGLLPGTGKPSENRGWVQLNPEGIGRHKEVMSVSRAHALLFDNPKDAAAHAGRLSQDSRRRSFLGYSAGQRLSSKLDQVTEILDFPDKVIQIGDENSPMLGILNHRGRTTPLVSLRQLLGEKAREIIDKPKVLFVEGDTTMFGFVVDRIDDIEFLNSDQELIAAGHTAAALSRNLSNPAFLDLLTYMMVTGREARSMAILDLAGLARVLEGSNA